MEMGWRPVADWFGLDMIGDAGIELMKIRAMLTQGRVSRLVGLVNPVPGEIFQQNRRNTSFFGSGDTQWSDIAEDAVAAANLGSQLVKQVGSKGEHLVELGDGGFNINLQGVVLDQTDVGLEGVVGIILQRSGEEMLGNGGEDIDDNFWTTLTKGGQDGDGSSGMAKAVGRNKTGNAVDHGSGWVNWVAERIIY